MSTPSHSRKERALVVGHLSTIGDIECLDIVSAGLRQARLAFDVAPFSEGPRAALPGAISIQSLDPQDYSHLIVVCGPCWPGMFKQFGWDLAAFEHCLRIGVNLTMVEPVGKWNPFHVLLERDSDRAQRPDLTFLQGTEIVPVVGLCIIEKQPEYGSRQLHQQAIALMRGLIDRRRFSFIDIDTRWPASRNAGGLGSPTQVASVLRRVDFVLTNRLHGLVFSLKTGVPVIALDPVAGGDKVTLQARTIDWPACALIDSATPDWLGRTADWCMSEAARQQARTCAMGAARALDGMRDELVAAIGNQFRPLPVPFEPDPPRVPLWRRGLRLVKRKIHLATS